MTPTAADVAGALGRLDECAKAWGGCNCPSDLALLRAALDAKDAEIARHAEIDDAKTGMIERTVAEYADIRRENRRLAEEHTQAHAWNMVLVGQRHDRETRLRALLADRERMAKMIREAVNAGCENVAPWDAADEDMRRFYRENAAHLAAALTAALDGTEGG